MSLILATTNSFKVRELRIVFQELLPTLTVRSLLDFPHFHPEEAWEHSFEKNAIAKALAAAKVLQQPCLADESGLVIPYLGDYAESLRRKKLQPPGKKLPCTKQLLIDLQSVEDMNRAAFLECVIAFATPDGTVKTASARMEGMIAHKEQGPSSFDFTSVFIKYEYSKTLAELPDSVTTRISHRRKACEKLWPALREFFGNGA
jgi:XTP/dITP diphosphohydrolase